jgi:hypothetical protein
MLLCLPAPLLQQAKLAVFVELFGRGAASLLLLRFPVILTMSTQRIREVGLVFFGGWGVA